MPERWVLRLLDCPGVIVSGMFPGERSDAGVYLASFDPEAHDGRGSATFTADPNSAMPFPSFAAAIDCWRTQSKRRPRRPDGQANRPLTAFTASPERVE